MDLSRACRRSRCSANPKIGNVSSNSDIDLGIIASVRTAGRDGEQFLPHVCRSIILQRNEIPLRQSITGIVDRQRDLYCGRKVRVRNRTEFDRIGA